MMEIRIQTIYLLWGVMLGILVACEPVVQGQIHTPHVSLSPDLNLLIKDSVLRDNVKIDKQGIHIYGQGEEEIDWFIYPEEYKIARQLLKQFSAERMVDFLNEKGSQAWSDQIKSLAYSPKNFHTYVDSITSEGRALPLMGLRVAIDPGHMAGNMEIAELEGKYVKMKASPRTEFEPISFFEANLTLSTAHLIREELENLGATVFMTRQEPGFSSMNIDYWTWKEEKWDSTLHKAFLDGDITENQATYYRKKAPEDKIFNHFFVRQDLRNRTKLINAFHPDLTLIIHYNVDAPNWLNRNEQGEFTPTDENYAMAFVPGAFMEGELDKLEDRVDFLRLLLSQEDLQASIRLSELFLKHSLELTQVPLVTEAQGLTYLKNASILTKSPGVYARNLSLSRMIKGPLVYGESLCQDNAIESIRLNKKSLEVEGIWVSERVTEIAQAYIRAVIDFAKEK